MPDQNLKADRLEAENALLRGVFGDLIDALHDELSHEVNHSPDVLGQVRKACAFLGPEYDAYLNDEWF